MTLGIWGARDATPWQFLRRCAYNSTRPNKLNFTFELPRAANPKLDTQQCRVKRPRRRAKTPGLGSEGESSGVVPFHLKPPTSGDAHGLARLIHERPPVLARANETTPLGASRLEKVALGEGQKRKEGVCFAISSWATCQLVVSIDALGAEQRLHGEYSSIWLALRNISTESGWSSSFAARLDLYAQRSLE